MSAGMPLITGLSTSLTVTVCVAVAVLPEASVAVQWMVVVPPGNGAESAAPSLRTAASVTPGALSVAVVPRLATSAAH